VTKCEDGGLEFVELDPPDPWTADPRIVEELQPGEVTLTYITHACVEVKAGSKRMMFDPWLLGPAFARGWWLLHEPPPDALDRLYTTDLVYISHMHSDHLSYPTLKLLAERRPDLPIYVGNTKRPVFWYLGKSGVKLTNINVVPFGVWQNVDEHLRFMILMDGIHPEMDTCIILEYKGHMILNTVDCTRPNNGRLPHGVDVMMGDFAGGASGFPMTFTGGKYTESWRANFIKTERRKLLNYKAQLVKTLRPKVYSPIAGYFTEAHPSDRYIKETNTKNDPVELNKLVKNTCPEVFTWTPAPGAVLDLCLALQQGDAVTEPPSGTKIYKDNWDFNVYLDELNTAVSSQIFKHKDWIEFYYKWAAFRDYNLVVRVIETDDEFQPLKDGYDYLVDFLDLSFPLMRPDREHAYIETWHNGLAVVARTWGTKCLFQHNKDRADPDLPSVGENLWAGAPPSTFHVDSAIKNWVDEDKDYDYSTHTCKAGKMCGHYTQVVWAETYKVGCAVISCPNGVKDTSFSHTPGAIFVCNYAPAGNYPRVYPYEQGGSCSKCGGEVCENNVC
ncbi:cytidine monophosphate-N-acetylneuraminic acid hydroxylase-like, partial [Clarias magur]